MADAPVQMIDFLMRTVTRLETEVAEKTARIKALEAWLEGQREHYTETGAEVESYLQLMDGDFKGPGG